MEMDTWSQKETIVKCVRRASRFRPCLCDFVSDEDAVIDVYITNKTKYSFKLTEESNIVATGSFGINTPGFWIIPPPKRIRGEETIFMRGYSGKVSTTDLNTCTNPVDYTISARYAGIKDPTDTFYVEVRALREAAEGSADNTLNAQIQGCAALQPFEPVNVADFSSNYPALNIYNLQAQIPDLRWRNTAFFLIA